MATSDALFLIPCCGKKSPLGHGAAWTEARTRMEWNTFPELNEDQDQLVNFYSSLTEEMAPKVYVGQRGRSEDRSSEVMQAWRKNLSLKSSATMPAIQRYDAILYEELGCELRNRNRVRDEE